MPSPSMRTVAPPRGSPPLPVTFPVITADCACASPDTALSNTSNAPAQTARPNVRCLMMVPPFWEMNTNPPARNSSGSSLGQASLYCIRPRKSAIPPRGGLSGPGIRRYLGNKLSKPKAMATNRPPLPRSRAALPLGFPYLCLGYLWLSVAPAAATPGLGQAAAAPHTDSSAIIGELEAQDTHEPITRAQVYLAGTAFATTTDSVGRFAFTDLDAGVFMIEIRAVGFAPGTWRGPLKAHQVLTHHFELERLPYELPEVVVKGKGPLSVRRFADFERRRQSGLGAFLTQERIERANTASLVDVLATVRGVKQVCISNECVAKMVRSPPGCYPQYYLDGNESSSYFARLTPPQDVKGVEIYRGSSETPGEFQGSNSGCGVIAIWTKSAP